MTGTEPASVIVYCDAASHTRAPLGPVLLGPDADARLRPSDAVVLGVFRRDADADADRWTLLPYSARRGGRLSRTQYRAVEAGNLRCPECDDTVRVNADRFNADLDAVAARDVSAMSLVGLRELRARRA